MSAPVKNTSVADTEEKPFNIVTVIKDLIGTAVIAMLILTPIVVIKTRLDGCCLVWEWRFDVAFELLAIVMVLRVLSHVWKPFVKPVVAQAIAQVIPARPASASKGPSLADRIGPYVPRALLIFALVLPILAHIGALTGYEIPSFGEKRLIDLSLGYLTYIMLGWGLNVVVGLAGLLDLGYVAFYAVGAYAYALLSTIYFPMWFGNGVVPYAFYLALPVSGLLAGCWGMILGFPVLRLRGDYLAIVTLAFGEIIRLVLLNWKVFTGGPNGMPAAKITFFGLPFNDSPEGFSAFFHLPFDRIYSYVFLYYVILALALLTYFVTKKLRRLPLGRAWEALREDEIACRSLGINTTNTKLSAFAIGASFGGFAGAFFAVHLNFVSPESFVYIESALILAIVVLGGLGSQIGIVFSAIVIMGGFDLFRSMDFLKTVLPNGTEPIQFRMLAVGLAMVLMMRFRPRGFVTKREPTVYLKEKKAISADLVAQGHG